MEVNKNLNNIIQRKKEKKATLTSYTSPAKHRMSVRSAKRHAACEVPSVWTQHAFVLL